tara:strand:- start:133 stop:1155 length:1023 start_codon:yes stop_codon:yes gene_type:complete
MNKNLSKCYLHNRLYENIPILKKQKKVKETNFNMLCFKDYNDILKYNYNVNQLKRIARNYKQKLSGNKKELLFRIYNYLKYSYNANKIQCLFRGYLNRLIYNNKNRHLECINETDFFSLDKLKEIKAVNFFMFREKEFNYGFNIKSIFYLVTQDGSKLNPYTRCEIPKKIINKIKKYIRVSKLLNKNKDFNISKLNNILSAEKKLELEVISVFQKIDNLNHITNPSWFLSLGRFSLYRFYRELKDIWCYRLQIQKETKINIIPQDGKPFIRFPSNFSGMSLLKMREYIIKIIDTFVTKGTSESYRSLGAYYILGALTLVSQSAASSLPWLFESFYYQPQQ